MIIEQQLKELKNKLNLKEWSQIVIAYEPTWDDWISPEIEKDHVKMIHKFIRDWIEYYLNKELAESIRIIYAGEVNAL